MITATTFLRSQGVILPDSTDLLITREPIGPDVSLCKLLNDFLAIKMEEKGFKVDDNNREDTMKM